MAVVTELLNFRFPTIDFRTICFNLALPGIVFLLYYIVKNIFRRMKYSSLPGVKFYFFDFLAGLKHLPFREKARNGYSLQTHALQITEGHSRLFPKETLVCSWFGFHPVALANKPESVQAIMTDSSLIEKSLFYKFVQPVMGTGLITSKESKWKPRRRMLNPSFHVNMLMDFMPIFNENAEKLVNKLQKSTHGEITELLEPISLCVLDIVCETILGTRLGAQDNTNTEYVIALRRAFKAIMIRIMTLWHWPGFLYRYSKSGKVFYQDRKFLNDFTRSVLQQKKKEYHSRDPDDKDQKRRSLMDILLEFHMEKKNITEEGIIEEVDTFTAASNESTAASLLFTLHLVGLDKDVQANAHQELNDIFGDDTERLVTKEDLRKMNYIECIIKESLRLFPTVPVFARETPENTTICGHKLLAGTTIGFIPYILHRDPEIFPDPERFDPTRFFPENCANRSQYAYIPFSAGARNCIGQKFAIMEMKVVLAHVLRSFTVESLDPRDKVLAAAELSLRTDINVRFRLFSRT